MRRLAPSPMPRFALRLRAPLAALLALGGCGSSLQSSRQPRSARITPYQIEVVQGNVVTKEQVARVKPGMSAPQVRDILGTPLLTDVVPCRPLGLRLHDPAPGRRAAAAPARRAASRATCWSASKATSCRARREFVASIDTSARPRARRRRSSSPRSSCKALPAPPAPRRAPPPEPPPAPRAQLPAARSRRPVTRRWRRTAHAAAQVAVAGASGRMGRMLIEAIARSADDCQLAGALDVAGSPAIGNDAARLPRPRQRRADHRRPARRPGRRRRC